MATEEGLYLGVDLGGTNIEAAAVMKGNVLESKKTSTQAAKGAEVVIGRIEKLIRKVLDKLERPSSEVRALCIGAPGAVNLKTGMVNEAPNLDWINVPLGAELEARLEIPVFVDNDVNVGTAGEHAFGAGQGARHMVGIFVGTGIGGGVILNNQLHYGGRGAAGEIGHMVIVPDGRICGCGKKGCVEAYASKTAVAAAIQEQISQGRDSDLKKPLKKSKGKPLSSSLIEKALIAGDPVTTEVIQQAQYHLGLLTANLVNAFDPEVIVFGGGLVEQLGDDFLKPIRRTAKIHYLQQKHADRIRIVPAALGDHAGTIGAAVVAQRRLESDQS